MRRDPVVLIVVAMLVSLMLVFGLHMSRRSSDPTAAKGKAVLLNFWATWCQPCKIEMPWFVELQKQYGPGGLQVLGIAMDDASPQDIAQFAKDLGVNYPVLIGKEAVGNAYGGVQFLPETFYIGRDGKIVDRVFGLKGRGEIEDDVKKALAQGQAVQAQR